MKKRLKQVIAMPSVMLMLAGAAVSADEPSVTISVEPNVIRLNETAVLKLNFNNLNPPQAPNPPQIAGFEISYSGQQSRTQIVNGRQSRQMTFTYTMVPRATGTFPIGPFTLALGNDRVEIAPTQLEVLPAAGTPPGEGSQTMSDLLFARLVLPRDEVYLQERFDVELHLYYRNISLDRGIQLQNLPGTGLNLDNFEEIGGSREVVNNEIYNVRRFRMRGTAISSGTIELMPMVRVNILTQQRRSDPFFSMFRIQDAEPFSVPTDPVEVAILPLPRENRPDDFSGAVGRFNMGVTIEPRELRAGDPITLTLRITGSGNFETISMPPVSLGDDFRSYDPKLMSVGEDHKEYQQVIIPRNENITAVPEITFTFFNPDRGAYETLREGPTVITVLPGAAGAQQMVQAPSAQAAEVKDPLGIDIIDLKRSSPVWAAPVATGWPAPAPVAAHVLPVLALGAGALLIQRRRAVNEDVVRRRRGMAPKSARAALKKADEARAAGNASAFHEAVWQALADYTGHRANLEPGEVSPSLILDRVRRGGLPEELAASLADILNACEEARFSGGGSGSADEMKAVQERVQEILRACERIRI